MEGDAESGLTCKSTWDTMNICDGHNNTCNGRAIVRVHYRSRAPEGDLLFFCHHCREKEIEALNPGKILAIDKIVDPADLRPQWEMPKKGYTQRKYDFGGGKYRY